MLLVLITAIRGIQKDKRDMLFAHVMHFSLFQWCFIGHHLNNSNVCCCSNFDFLVNLCLLIINAHNSWDKGAKVCHIYIISCDNWALNSTIEISYQHFYPWNLKQRFLSIYIFEMGCMYMFWWFCLQLLCWGHQPVISYRFLEKRSHIRYNFRHY